MDSQIELKSVSFSYRTGRTFLSKKNNLVLDRLSLEIFKGETLGIVGQNGAGKSTLLRLLSNIVTPDDGHIIRNCSNVNLLSIELGFSERLDGYSNIILSGLFNGFAKSEIKSKVDDIIEMADIGEAIKKPLITFSTGMKARLGFSIAYHLQPDILLIDEILGVGDIDFQIKSERLIKEKMNSDQTVVLVSHDPHLITNMCKRVIWIENGKIHMQGPADVVMKEYLKYMLPDGSLLGDLIQYDIEDRYYKKNTL